MDAQIAPAWAMALAANFGSVERWRDEFVALGKSQQGRPGWALLVFEPRTGTLAHRWAADPAQAPAGDVPILAVAGDGVDAFMADVDWAGMYERYQAAVHEASEPFAATHEEAGGALLLDVRRAGAYADADSMIPGARWRDPAQVALWARELPHDRSVVVYCVYGHEVGRATALRLRAAGVNARFLQGGIDGWQAAGRPLANKRTG